MAASDSPIRVLTLQACLPTDTGPRQMIEISVWYLWPKGQPSTDHSLQFELRSSKPHKRGVLKGFSIFTDALAPLPEAHISANIRADLGQPDHRETHVHHCPPWLFSWDTLESGLGITGAIREQALLIASCTMLTRRGSLGGTYPFLLPLYLVQVLGGGDWQTMLLRLRFFLHCYVLLLVSPI